MTIKQKIVRRKLTWSDEIIRDVPANTYLYFYSLNLSPYLLSFEAWGNESVQKLDYRSEIHLAAWFDFAPKPEILDSLLILFNAPSSGRLAFISPNLCYFWRLCGWDYVQEAWYRKTYIRLNFWQTINHREGRYHRER